jgi:hypothetical protein
MIIMSLKLLMKNKIKIKMQNSINQNLNPTIWTMNSKKKKIKEPHSTQNLKDTCREQYNLCPLNLKMEHKPRTLQRNGRKLRRKMLIANRTNTLVNIQAVERLKQKI